VCSSDLVHTKSSRQISAAIMRLFAIAHYLTFPLMEENAPSTLMLSRNVYAQH